LGALLATGVFARGSSKLSWARADPSLWRVWGWSGAATSIFFYLVEYFPSHLGMRLEVNHPLYALAWAGGGEIIFRLCRWLGGGKLAEQPREWAWLAGSALAIVIVPVIIYVFADQVFWIASWTNNSKFLFIFHEDYIAEFKDMRRYVDAMYAGPNAGYSLSIINPLVLLAVPMLAWCCGRLRQVMFGLLAVGLVVFDLFLVSFHHYIYHQSQFPSDYYAWLFLVGPLAIFVFLLCLWEPWPKFPLPCLALLVLPLPGGLLTMFLSLREMRWMEIGYSFWLAAAAGAFLALRLHAGYRWTAARTTGLGIFIAAVLLPNPLITINDWIRWHGVVPMSDVELMEIVTRDAAQRLRARLGDQTGVVVSGPTTTTWMTYWGGIKGLGTLYWENLAGLKADMAVYSAPTADEALAQIKKYGVTHIAIFSWDPFYKEYARLSQNMHRPITDTEYVAEAPLRGWLGGLLPTAVNHSDEVAAEIPKIQKAFIYDLIEHRNVPAWLRPIFYPMPNDPIMRGQYVALYEVVPEQSPKEAKVRGAQRDMASGNYNDALAQVKDALQIDPNYLPALICGARILNLAGNTQAFASVMQAVRNNMAQADSLTLEDRMELIIALVLNNDMTDSSAQIKVAMNAATTSDIRRLTWEQLYNFVSFLRQVGLINARPGLAGFIEERLPPFQRVEFMIETASAEKKAGHLAEALALYRRAHELMPNALPGLLNLADFLATTHDDTLRNGREAVVLALQAHELDHGQHADILDALGCAYAETGQFTLAATVEQLALNIAEAAHDGNLSTQYRSRLAAFRNHLPYHE
jgi:tetratricopeptide (TPR) repeat protein